MFLLAGHTIHNSIVVAVIRNFNHGQRNRAVTKVFWEELKIGAKVELDNAVRLIGKSIHRSSWIVATAKQILESNSLTFPVFEERYLTSCKA